MIGEATVMEDQSAFRSKDIRLGMEGCEMVFTVQGGLWSSCTVNVVARLMGSCTMLNWKDGSLGVSKEGLHVGYIIPDCDGW